VTASLHILVVDDRPDSVLFLTEFLLKRKHRVETVANGKDALTAIQRRRSGGDAYDLVVSEIGVPGMDGLSLLRELRRRQDPVDFAICTAYASINPNLTQESDRLGCLGVLEKPVDLLKLDQLVDRLAIRKRAGPGTSKSDQPFFGTSRIVRSDDVGTASIRREATAPGAGLERRDQGQAPAIEPPSGASPSPVPTLEPPPARFPTPMPFDDGTDRHSAKRQVRSFSHNAPPDAAGARPTTDRSRPPVAQPIAQPGTDRQQSGTDRIQPSTDRLQPTSDRHQRPPTAIPVAPEALEVPKPGEAPTAGDATKPLAPLTTRLRRTITGTERITRSAPAQSGDSAVPAGSHVVACAICGKAFVVLSKPAAYSVVCVHCGQVNRVEPLPAP
jgi:CheY-like chemotaxis protein